MTCNLNHKTKEIFSLVQENEFLQRSNNETMKLLHQQEYENRELSESNITKDIILKAKDQELIKLNREVVKLNRENSDLEHNYNELNDYLNRSIEVLNKIGNKKDNLMSLHSNTIKSSYDLENDIRKLKEVNFALTSDKSDLEKEKEKLTKELTEKNESLKEKEKIIKELTNAKKDLGSKAAKYKIDLNIKSKKDYETIDKLKSNLVDVKNMNKQNLGKIEALEGNLIEKDEGLSD